MKYKKGDKFIDEGIIVNIRENDDCETEYQIVWNEENNTPYWFTEKSVDEFFTYVESAPEWLKAKRQELKLSQDALADISHVSRATIINAEKVGAVPTFETQYALADALGYKLSLNVQKKEME